MSMKLHAPLGNFRTNSILIAAEVAGVNVELVHTDYSSTKTAEFKAKNPLGKVPVLETTDGFLFETAAILRHIARVSGKLYGENNY
jgi:elongation factor 1-gamma